MIEIRSPHREVRGKAAAHGDVLAILQQSGDDAVDTIGGTGSAIKSDEVIIAIVVMRPSSHNRCSRRPCERGECNEKRAHARCV